MADFRTMPSSAEPGEPTARKTAAEENFPVASRLVPARLRPHVMAFYAFVRLADDIADDPYLEPDVKIAQLDALERALVSGVGTQAWLAPALQLKASLTATGVSGLHARQVLQAFRRDAQGGTCKQWGDLVLYCRYSANPVGRFLLELHGESMAAAPAADALCTALQILNHIQDCRADWVDLGRCYLPIAWFAEAGGHHEQLVEENATPAVRKVIDRTLDQVDALLDRARALPRLVRHPGLRMEAAVILRLAIALAALLRKHDPLAGRVEVGTLGRVGAVLLGIGDGLSRRPRKRKVPKSAQEAAGKSGSTFYWPLRLLPPEKRSAMFAIYAFCRAVDDVADGPSPVDAKRAALAEWRRRVEAIYAELEEQCSPNAPLRDLAVAVKRFGLPKVELDAIIDGMLMDVDGPIRAPDLTSLSLYCRRVAGAVGLVSIRVFGRDDPQAQRFAIVLGDALQMTNILRDLAEDARDSRCYLPWELLLDAGIDPSLALRDPNAVLAHVKLGEVCEALAERAEEKFREARSLLTGDIKPLAPAVAMMLLYHRLLQRLRARGWRDLTTRPRLGKVEKIGIALRSALGRPPTL